jgi:hypothetical protein
VPTENLTNVFVKGNSIKIRFNHKDDWEENIISMVYGSTIEIEIKEYNISIDEFLAIGDSVECRYFKSETEYFIRGWVSKLKTDIPATVTVEIHKWGEVEEQAECCIHEVVLGGIVKKSNNDKGIFVSVSRISKEEIAFSTKVQIQDNESMLLEVLISEKICFKSLVEITSYKKTKLVYKYTAKFIKTDILNKKILGNFLDELGNGAKDSYNKQNSFWKQHSKIFTIK